MALGFDSTAWISFVEAWFVWMLSFLDLDGGRRTLDFSQGKGLTALRTGEGGRGGVGRSGKEMGGG